MPQPKDVRSFHPRFYEVLQRAAQGEEIWFEFPDTPQGRGKCFSLRMALAAFLKRISESKHQPEDIVAAAFSVEIKTWQYKNKFVIRPKQTWDEELSEALDKPRGDFQ